MVDPKPDLKALRKRLLAVREEREALRILICIAREEKSLAKDRAEYERLQDPDEPAYEEKRLECCDTCLPF